MKAITIDILNDIKVAGQYTKEGNIPTPKKNEKTIFSSCASSKLSSIR